MTSLSTEDGYYTDVEQYFQEHGVQQAFVAFYKNNVQTESGTIFSAKCSSSGGWDSASDSKSGSVDIPLYKYDDDGNIAAILNVIHISCAREAMASPNSTYASATLNYTLQTDTNAVISSGESSQDINLFGIDGLDGATVMTLSGSGSVSTSNRGFTHSEYDGHQRASAELSYSLEYVKVD